MINGEIGSVTLSLVQQLCMTSRLRASNHTRQPLLGSLEGAKAPFRVLPQLAIESTTGSARSAWNKTVSPRPCFFLSNTNHDLKQKLSTSSHPTHLLTTNIITNNRPPTAHARPSSSMFHGSNTRLNAAGLAPEHSKLLPERQPKDDEADILNALHEVSSVPYPPVDRERLDD